MIRCGGLQKKIVDIADEEELGRGKRAFSAVFIPRDQTIINSIVDIYLYIFMSVTSSQMHIFEPFLIMVYDHVTYA